VRRLKWAVLTINVAMVAVATAFTGVIGFVGLIVPHILRIIHGADNRYLIAGSALLGATLLSVADLVARVSLRPAELPIGIVTSIVGVPVFLWRAAFVCATPRSRPSGPIRSARQGRWQTGRRRRSGPRRRSGRSGPSASWCPSDAMYLM
jgi:hypothetical protein